MKTYSIGQFAEEIGVTVQTLRNWDKSGKLKPNYVSPSGHRYYSDDQLMHHEKPEVSKSSDTVDLLLQMLIVFKNSIDNEYIETIDDCIRSIEEIKESGESNE